MAFKSTTAPVKSEEWHTLRVDFAGNRFSVTLDGRKLIEVSDDSLPDAGMVGLWTKADSVTISDDFSYGAG